MQRETVMKKSANQNLHENEVLVNLEESQKSKIQLPLRTPDFPVQQKDRYTILCPQMAPIHFALAEVIFESCGFHLEILPDVDRNAIEEGLRYVNNDVCYPAIVVVGQLIQALKSGKYDLSRTALMISQTCGGCRSTNYATFLKIATLKAGFPEIPVIPFNINVTTSENPGGVTVTFSMVRKLFFALLYGDLLLRVSNSCRPYEVKHGTTDALVKKWLHYLRRGLLEGTCWNISKIAAEIVKDFESLELVSRRNRPKVGIVGEILVKYHPGANNNLVSLVEKEGGEAVIPDMMDFVLYCVSSDQFREPYSRVSLWDKFTSRVAVWLIEHYRNKIRKVLNRSERFTAEGEFRHLVKKAAPFVSTCNHTGEGWLLTAEMVELIEHGTPNIICVQPFGCLPNHITGKGVMKALKTTYPHANIAIIDYDPGTTEVNQLNRIKLMMAVAVRNLTGKTLGENFSDVL
ncbi:MAG: 2-hydroxyacyl-CoA dehydratase [Planctomycetia bacterium]|nr:2-hydroxyacyl-CoA dehydratase [Planctomycetia bacterium]